MRRSGIVPKRGTIREPLHRVCVRFVKALEIDRRVGLHVRVFLPHPYIAGYEGYRTNILHHPIPVRSGTGKTKGAQPRQRSRRQELDAQGQNLHTHSSLTPNDPQITGIIERHRRAIWSSSDRSICAVMRCCRSGKATVESAIPRMRLGFSFEVSACPVL